MRPPPPLALNRYPVTAATGVLAVIATLAWWAKLDVAFLFSGYRSFNGEPWRLLTSVLLHSDVIHLVFNLYWLWVFGTLVEEVFGHLKTAAILLWLAAGSAAFAGLFGEDGVGLSGVGYGLFGLLYVLSRRDERFADAVDQRTTTLFVAWFFICILMTVTGVYRIANIAHGGGAVLGFLTGLAVGWRVRVVWRVALALLSLGAVLAVGFLWRPYLNFFHGRGVDLARAAYETQAAGDDERAAALYERALDIDRTQSGWWFNLGLAYQALERPEDAEAAFERAADFSPRGSQMRTERASRAARRAARLFAEGDLEGAVQQYERATKLNRDDARSWYHLGVLSSKLGKIEEARDALRQASNLEPENLVYKAAADELEPANPPKLPD